MGVGLFKKYVSSSMIICYRSVARHPFLVCMVFLLIWMQRLFPLFFSFLVSSSPVIVSTAVLLGTLLSYGQPNIPEIEKERPKSEQHEIRKLESKVTSQTEVVGRDGNFASEETNGSRIEVVDRSFEVEKPVHDDNSCVEVNKPLYLVDDGETVTEENGKNPQIGEEQFVEEPNYVTDEVKVVLGSRYSPLKQSEDDHIALESDDRLWEGSADPLNSDPALLWKRVEGDDDDDGEDDDDDDDGSDSDLAESSSPDASMADIIPMLDELHPLLSEEHEIRQVHNDEDGIENHDDSEHSIESSESSSSSESDNDDGVKLHEDLVAGDEDEDRESKHSDKEDEQRSAITWTEDDQKNLMNLGTSEIERNRHLENLIAMRMAQKTHEDSESGDEEEHDDEEDKEDKHTDKEDEPKSAITWTEDDQKNLMNLGTSELERNRHLENLIAMRRAQKTHEDLESGDEEEHEDEEDKEDKHTDKEDEPKSAITWTEDDQKNLMNLGTSELERNRRLENLIARRRARNTMRMQAESNLIDLDTADFPWNNIPPISTARNNPFDYDSHDNIPGSAPSVLLKRRNPFDLPYDSSEEKPDLVGDTFQQEILGFQPKEPHFRRHESFNVGPSNFGGLRSERQETKLRPYFVPERVFQRQFSGISDSKASSVPDTESVSSADDDVDDDDDLEDRNHEDEHSLKLVSEKDQEHEELTSGSHERPYFVPEHVDSVTYERQLSEVSDSKLSSIHDDTDSVSSKDHNSLEPELGSEKDQENEELTSEIHERPYFVPEHVDSVAFERQSSEVSDSKESVSSVDDLVINDCIALSQEPELISFEDDDNVESVQVPEGEISVSNVTNQQEVVNDVSSPSSSSSSSSSSSNEESEQIYNEKEGDDVATSVSETSYNFEDHDSNQIERSEIGLSLEVSQPKEPVYDMSPRSITRNLSSSSICNGLKEDVSERVQSLPTSEATSSLQSQEIVPKMEMESRSITDNGLNEDGLNKDESFKHNDEQHESSSSVDVLDMNAYQQLQQVQEPESNEVKSLNSEPQIPEVVHEENLELLEFQDPGNEISVNINSDVVEVVETEDNDDEIDEDLLVELDAVGDFSFSDLVSTLNDMEIEEDPHVLQEDEDSNSKDLGTTLNLETKPSGNKEDSCSKDLESTLDDEIKQNHDFETKISVDDEDSYSKDLESNLNEETEEGNNNILETFYSVDEHAFSKIVESTLNEIKYQPQMLDHVLETNSSGDQDLLNKPLKMDDQGQVMEKESDKKEVEAEPIKTNFINDTKNETENESSTSNTVKE